MTKRWATMTFIGLLSAACAGSATAVPPPRVSPPPPPALIIPASGPVPVMRERGGAIPGSADRACLRTLEKRKLLFVPLSSVRGVRTPVVITGPIGGVNLLARAGRPPVMDCSLARALGEVAPVFRKLHVTALAFSGAYEYRARRGTQKLSEHAHGLAIDVHAIETTTGRFEVTSDYPRNSRRWESAEPGAGALDRCVGNPARNGARTLRSLACRLKLHPAFRVVLTPDDNADHHDHLHIETFPGDQRREPPSPRLLVRNS